MVPPVRSMPRTPSRLSASVLAAMLAGSAGSIPITPSQPRRKPSTSQPRSSAESTTERMQALRPGTSPPPVKIPIRILLPRLCSLGEPSIGGGDALQPGRDESTRRERILRLAWPIMLTSLNWTLMHLIDVVVVGQYGTDELAALAASRTLTFISIVMGFPRLSGVLVYASRADGGGRLGRDRRHLPLGPRARARRSGWRR